MKKSITLILVLLLSLLASTALFAGGAKEAASEPSSSETPLKVTWWGGQKRHDITQNLFAAYEAINPGIKFEGTPSNWDGYFDKLATTAASGSLPDIIQMDYLYLATYAKNNSLTDLFPYVNDGTIDVSAISKNSLNTGVIDGKLQSLVLSTSIIAWPYSQKVLQEAGIAVPTSDWTWEDFVSISKTVKDKTGKFGFGIIPSGDVNLFNYYVRQHGVKLFADDKKSLGYSDDQIMVKWLTMWKDLQDYGAIPTPDEYAAIQVAGTDSSPIVSDNAAFITEWSNFSTKVESKNPNISLLTPPRLNGGENGLWMKPGMFFAIASNSRNKTEAAAFINWVVNSKQANDIIMAERGTPISSEIRDYMADSGKLSAKQEEMFQYTTDAAEISGPALSPDPLGIAEINDVYDEVLYSVLYNQSTPLQAAATFRSQANEILTRNN